MAIRKISTYLDNLDKEPDNQNLSSKIRELKNIQQSLSPIIPSYLKNHCSISLPKNGILKIYTKNGSIATKLKQITPTLLKNSQKLGWQITSIQISTQAYSHDDKYKNISKKRDLGQNGITFLTQLASSLPPSATLKTAIISLLKKNNRYK